MKKLKVKNAYLIDVPMITDSERGSLAILETGKYLPFVVRRTYYMFNVPENVTRGGHAHKKTNQVLLCLQGSVRLALDDGKNKEELVLIAPSQPVFLGAKVWHNLSEFKKGTVVLLLASHGYNEADYIRDYNEFLKRVK